jgi:D-glycero-D-manno-heptose 1,7-bisphosphate phosphatase
MGHSHRAAFRALLCDRDGTLIEDVPYNREPDQVRPLGGVDDALRRARAGGLRVGVITNQSGVARGLISTAQLDAVQRRVDELLGPFDVVLTCRHGPDDGCPCRKPEPGLVIAAADALGLPPAACVVVGDQERDVEAAQRAGACGILVDPSTGRAPTAPAVASFRAAVDLVLGGA